MTSLFMKTPSYSEPPLPAHLTRRGVIFMLLSVTGFTANSLLLKYLGSNRELPAILPLLFRAGVGIVIVLTVFRGRRPTRIAPVFTERLLIARGLTGLLGTAAYYWTVPALGAGKATLFCNTYVIFASAIAAIFLGELLTWRRLVWLGIAFGGIVLLTGPNIAGTPWTFGVHEAVALGGAVTAAVSVVLVRQLTVRHSIGTIYLAQCAWIILPILPFTVGYLPGLAGTDWTLLVLAAIAAGFGQLSMNEGFRCLAVSTGASLQMLWPLLTAIGGLAFFDERFAPLQIGGAVLILISTWTLSTRKG
ncbi:MAG: DMT family transporter [Verrucomicrobiae bacterium]|nr:DMT family transporter [Verrucomicrobiae bacterium]